jgi:hypothetical protein
VRVAVELAVKVTVVALTKVLTVSVAAVVVLVRLVQAQVHPAPQVQAVLVQHLL